MQLALSQMMRTQERWTLRVLIPSCLRHIYYLRPQRIRSHPRLVNIRATTIKIIGVQCE